MNFYIQNDELEDYFSKIKFVFKNITHTREHLDIIFVFGKNDSLSPKKEGSVKTQVFSYIKNKLCFSKDHSLSQKKIVSGRTQFFNYLKTKKETHFNFITIENLYKDLREHAFTSKGVQLEKIKLAELEYIAIKNASSVLIFPESPGSFAELGYFSAREETRQKIVVSNRIDHHAQQSYVNSIVDLIHEKKEIKPIIYIDNDGDKYFEQYIKSILNSYTDYKEEVYKKGKPSINNHMYPIGIIYELIRLFPYLIFSELFYLVKHSFKELFIEMENIENYVKAMLSLLVISKLIERDEKNERTVFCIIDDSFSCFKFDYVEEKHLELILHKQEIEKRKLGK
jgi:hypothetical protein